MWALILHGGAKEIEPDEADAHRSGCLAAIEAGRAILAAGGGAVDAVEAAIRELESDPTFNAGYGAALNSDGEVEMCSGVMEGTGFNVGAVAVIKGVRHPVSVARAMLHEEPILLAAEGARRFAAEKRLELCNPADLIAPAARLRKNGTHDTVGCVALDQRGRMAAGTSTGGLDGCAPGRIGDSPVPGCGYYVDDQIGGVAFSGDGEHIARKMLAARVMHALASASPDEALLEAIDQVEAIEGEAGGILLTPDGRFAWHHNSRDFAVALESSEMSQPVAYTNKKDEPHE
ncbi:MAG: peptidase t2 asparaginase 2 [Devosia sp.]|nr:peptidase t2 asparaginase 2 [Devosia sp.]